MRGGSSPLRIGIAGLGTVGAGTFRLLADNAELLAQRTGRPFVVTAVSARDPSRARGLDLTGVRWHADARALAEDLEVDLVCELVGGSEGVAVDLVRASLRRGRPVVTANKAMLAVHGDELARLAEDSGTQLRWEAAVAGGIPIIRSLGQGLAANRILRVYGILNGTCNFILTTMRETGREFADVLAEAQSLGYAEADPAFDVDGIDAAHKLALLAALAFGGRPRFDAIHIEGIRHVSAMDIAFAEQLGYRIKLLGVARVTQDGLEQRMHPCMVPAESPIGQVEGVFNGVVVEGDQVGSVVHEGRGAGAGPTASAVVGDIVDIARGAVLPTFGVPARALADHHRAVDVEDVERLAHRVDGGLVGGLLVAIADQAGARQGRGLGHADGVQGEVAVLAEIVAHASPSRIARFGSCAAARARPAGRRCDRAPHACAPRWCRGW